MLIEKNIEICSLTPLGWSLCDKDVNIQHTVPHCMLICLYHTLLVKRWTLTHRHCYRRYTLVLTLCTAALSVTLHSDFCILWHTTCHIRTRRNNVFRLGSSTNTVYIYIYIYIYSTTGFGGLGVGCWPLVPKFPGSNPAETVGFLGRKNPQHDFLRRGSKAVGLMS